ncbi:MAG: putative glycoside hydrolase, partial [Victivallaceae bacterium]
MMLEITKKNAFSFEWRRRILVLGLCMMSFMCCGDDFKFTRTCLVRVGGSGLASGDQNTIAKYDLVALNRFFWNDINGNSWGAIKSINPDIQIYLYQLGSEINDNSDGYTIEYLNNLGRWNNRRTVPGANVNQDHPEFFLLDSASNRIYNTGYPNSWRMDIGLADYQDYWLDATISDIVNQSWTADGVFVDNCLTLGGGASSVPAKYSTNALWIAAMHSFINATTAGLHAVGQKTFCNRGESRTVDGYNAYVALDSIANPPDITLEEGAFAVTWGSGSDVQFYPEADWKRQVDVLGAVHNYKIVHESHTDLAAGGTGTDNYGKSVGYYDILWYSLCSYNLGKNEVNDNSYFAFAECGNYNLLPWYDEFDTARLNLGRAVGPYQIKVISGNNIYMREFVKGYVYVNPTANDVTSVGLRETCKQLTHDNFQNDPSTITDASTINLASHRGTILLKSSTALTGGTVYEDAENGNTAGWDVYDNDPSGTVSNVYDTERAGQVITLAGGGWDTGYRKRTDANADWNNSTQFALEWKIKYSERFSIYIALNTSAGLRYLAYTSNYSTPGGTGTYVYYNLGTGTADGKWHTIVRDLKADLARYQPTVTLNSVNAFLIRGSGCVDDIRLRTQDTAYEDAENGNTDGWSIYDANTTGTMTNIDDATRGGKIIRLTGNQSNTGFKKLTDAGANWGNTTQFTLEWSMKTSVYYTIYILVGTSAGDKYLQYNNATSDALGTGTYIVHGLGSVTT